ncbi:hypothetical protein B484DRAFT_416777 [Ochromonadaceae sp. CCMP2298]|nr:hypothetical protein B484DRAFT_416777 [Ochromonadaceae sp. CCMP2298]
MDISLYNTLHWIWENDISGIIYETFSVPGEGDSQIPLCGGGADREVTELNKREYVKLYLQWSTYYSVLHLLNPFLAAFHSVIPLCQIQGAYEYTIYVYMRLHMYM